MFKRSLKAGLTGVAQRPDLVFLTYGLNLLPALVLTLPLYYVLAAHVGPTGFSGALARDFDLVLWADILEETGALLSALWLQLLWTVPLYLVWKAALTAGLVHALRGSRMRSFWQGVGRYTVRSTGLGLLFLPLLLGWGVVVIAAALLLHAAWPGEVGAFWTFGVFTPLLLLTGLALIDLMQDYGRAALVLEERLVPQAWRAATRWPFTYRRAAGLYLLWLGVAALLLALPTLFEMYMDAASAAALWGLFLLQQAVLLLRAAATVAWIGSEVAFYEAVRLRESPLLAVGAPPRAARPPARGALTRHDA